jgi:hypothetical protein
VQADVGGGVQAGVAQPAHRLFRLGGEGRREEGREKEREGGRSREERVQDTAAPESPKDWT